MQVGTTVTCLLSVSVLVCLSPASPVRAEGFKPEFSARFLGVVSLDVSQAQDGESTDANVGIGFGDTGVELGSRLMLRRNVIAGVDVGFQIPDDG